MTTWIDGFTGRAINAGKIFTLIAGWIYRRQMGLLTAEAENALPPNSRRLHGDMLPMAYMGFTCASSG